MTEIVVCPKCEHTNRVPVSEKTPPKINCEVCKWVIKMPDGRPAKPDKRHGGR